ncbi:MAG: [protein-PII] uridylyltransferase [Hyphomicrobiaceae bacterium]
MSTSDLPEPPFFDPAALRSEFTAIYKAGNGAEDCRPQVLARLKELLADAHAAARARIAETANGRDCASALAVFHDELIHLIFDYTVAHVYHVTTSASADEKIAIAATGGYGRGLLAPYSDIDLLFILPYRRTPWSESVAEYMLYLLWDLGLKVGHATRTVAQCVSFAKSDMTIRTSLLDARYLLGDETLYAEFESRFAADVVAGTEREFIEAKMAEREGRHKQTGESRYRVEPNVKDGKGGLRDLHTLHWLSKYAYGAGPGDADMPPKVFEPEEIATFNRSADFLWTVRCLMHFERGRADERLGFEMQPAIAEQLNYREDGSLLPVERFMRHYFLVAKDVGELTAILCSSLEMQQLAAAPRVQQYLNPLNWATRRRVRRMTEFRIDNDRLNVADPGVFKRDPVNLLRIFVQAAETATFLHPTALRLIRDSLRLVDDKLRNDPEANRIFLSLLVDNKKPEHTLRRMNEIGVLGRFLPDWGSVVSMMQFNMYHHFTVDEHLVRTVGQLTAIENHELADTLPLSNEIISTIQNRKVLYVAALLHDIGKGRPEDHSIVGARIAEQLCPRLGLSKGETDTVAWLVREHLTMSNVSQSRDLSDPKTIRDFAEVVQTRERLKLLLLLTVADIRAVGPGTWNGWKGQLLRELYHEAEVLVGGGNASEAQSRFARADAAQNAFRAACSDWPAEDVDRFIENQYTNYWLRTDTARQIEHAKLVRDARGQDVNLATSFRSDAFTAITDLEILAPNHPRLLSVFAGCCASAGANIIGAQISTTRNGLALDTFSLERGFEREEDENRRLAQIRRTIERVLKGEMRLSETLENKRPSERRIDAFTVEPEIVIANNLSDHFTVIEVAGLDRPGLLYELTSAISDLQLDINSAHITTFGEKAVDVFYLTDLTAKKIVDPKRQAVIRERLERILVNASEEAVPSPA